MPPQLLVSNEPGIAESWASADQSHVDAAKAGVQQDLTPIYDNIAQNGDDAWAVALSPTTGANFLISFGDNGAAVWVYPSALTTSTDPCTFGQTRDAWHAEVIHDLAIQNTNPHHCNLVWVLQSYGTVWKHPAAYYRRRHGWKQRS